MQTAVVWGDEIPILLPLLTSYLSPAATGAPALISSEDDVVVFSWPELASVLRPFPKRSDELDSYELFMATPSEIERVITAKQSPQNMPKGVTVDQVLDRELVEQARQQLTSG